MNKLYILIKEEEGYHTIYGIYDHHLSLEK